MLPGSSLRPDGTSVVPWLRGRCIAWDVTCPDTIAASYLADTAAVAGAAAERAASAKASKYLLLATTHTFMPLAFETLGPLNAEAVSCLDKLGGLIIAKTGDPRERAFLYQRLSMAVQRGNVACFSGSMHQDHFFSN